MNGLTHPQMHLAVCARLNAHEGHFTSVDFLGNRFRPTANMEGCPPGILRDDMHRAL